MSRGVWVTVDSFGEHRRMRRYRAILWQKLQGAGAPCHWCGKPLEWNFDRSGEHGTNLEVDHVDFDETNDHPDNLVPCCPACNRRRKNPENIGERCNADLGGGLHCARAIHTGAHATLWGLSQEKASAPKEIAVAGKVRPVPEGLEIEATCWYCGHIIPTGPTAFTGAWICGECGEEN